MKGGDKGWEKGNKIKRERRWGNREKGSGKGERVTPSPNYLHEKVFDILFSPEEIYKNTYDKLLFDI